MNIVTITDAVAATGASLLLERITAQPSRLWSPLVTAWIRRLDQRIEDDLQWLDHTDLLADFRRASRD